MFVDPPRTEFDFNFQLLGIPVRVSPWFWLLAVLLGLGRQSSREILIWVAVVFVSILVHEFGHALVIRYYGWSPRIVLYSFGGLAIYDPSFATFHAGRRARRTGIQQILISLAGPGAGFLFASLVVALLYLSKYYVWFPYVDILGVPEPLGQRLGGPLELVAFDLLQVNIFWGVLNLTPIYPLDGGQVARELLLANSTNGVRRSLTLSFVSALALAIFALVQLRATYMAMMFGYMAYMNYTQLNRPFNSFGGDRPW